MLLFPLLILLLVLIVFGSFEISFCSIGDECQSCAIKYGLASSCSKEDGEQIFLFCNPRSKRVDIDASSYLICLNGFWRQKTCSENGRIHFHMTTRECVDVANIIFHSQGTFGSGRAGDVCSFNTDCLGGMYCAAGQCRCLSTYVAVDAYCYEKISPSESGCFYDIQCSSVWPDSSCKNGQCTCPSEDMVAVKTKDGTMCVWSTSIEPACPLPSLPPPESPAALVVLPAPASNRTVSIAACNPHSSSLPSNEEDLLQKPHEYKCAVREMLGENPSPADVSDIYECIDNTLFWKSHGIDINSHPVGVCCMNRAFTCQQPKRGESDALGSVPRWWFNSVVGSCLQFLFDPNSSEVSPNNFETLDHCESFCKDTCPRGNPAYLALQFHLSQSPQIGCTLNYPCPYPFVCTEVASLSMCCPTRKMICSESGGRMKDVHRVTPYDSGIGFNELTGDETINNGVGVSTRYYYSPKDGQCYPFTYNGYLGNFNNFFSHGDCQIFCSRLQCPHGSPLSNGRGAPQRCRRDSECPSTHICSTEHAVCCIRPQTLCTEPLLFGDCKQSIRQFWYNAETRSCETFMYTGCQGNNNRFHSLNECRSFCKNINAEPKCLQGRAYTDPSGRFLQCGESEISCPSNYECHFDGVVHGCCPMKAYTCSLSMNKGLTCGSGSSYRFYYNSQMKECQSFLFMGCDGNSNNFPNIEKCQNYCEIAVCSNGGSPLRFNLKVVTCSVNEHCPNGYECSQVDSNEITHGKCCPSKVTICSKPPQMGIFPKCGSSGGQTKFYFNIALRSCSTYKSNGCDISMNSFSSLQECENFCFSAGCKAGDMVYKDPNMNRPLLCNIALQNNCPSTFQCTFNMLTQNHVCCGSESMGICPFGEKVFIDSRTSTPLQCAMTADGRCPPGYLCRLSSTKQKYYCCGSINGTLCPSGHALFRYSSSQLPSQCRISKFISSCPPTYTCLSSVPNAFQGYCCSIQTICPGGLFHIDNKTQMPTTCTNEGFTSCPQGYSCQQQPETNNYYCCTSLDDRLNDGCPPSQFAYFVGDEVKTCDPFNSFDSICPLHYTCQWSLKNQKYQCCGTRLIKQTKSKIDDGCLNKQFALINLKSGKPRVCTPGEEKSCPIGFFCQFSAKKFQFQCCGQSGGCPPRRAAYIAMNGDAQECVAGPNMCAKGYECVTSLNGKKRICCSKEDNGETKYQP